MKTAIQELIERAEKANALSVSGSVNYYYVIYELKHFLDKEKEQITDAYLSGYDDGERDNSCSSEDYYNSTFKNEE